MRWRAMTADTRASASQSSTGQDISFRSSAQNADAILDLSTSYKKDTVKREKENKKIEGWPELIWSPK